MIKLNYARWGVLLSVLLVFASCDRDNDNPAPTTAEEQVKKAIFDSMKEWYFWENQLPVSFNPAQYGSKEEVLDALMYQELDRWSYLTTRAAFDAAFTGQVSGAHGFSFALDAQEKLFVSFVFKDGPAGLDGWQRGWEILEINNKPISQYKTASGSYSFDLGANTPGVSNSFKFRLPDGTETARTIQKAAFQSNSVLHQNVYEVGGKKVGYWVYQSFRATAGLTPTRSQEVDDSFANFQAAGIDELVIDLRYNGGGSVAVTEQILNYLAPASATGKVMYTNQHNGNKFGFNRTVNFNKKGSLSLSRVIFITSRGSASASELLINCLSPYLDLVLIGDRTYGKPVGSFPLSGYNRVLSSNDVELVPITFAIANSQGKAEYFEGFPVDFPVNDSPSKNWGDMEESRFKAALDFIQNGSPNARLRQDFARPKWEMIDAFKGLQKEFPMF